MAVIYEGLKDLKQDEIKLIKELVEPGYERVKRDFVNSKLVVDVQKADKAGNRAKYTVHLRLDNPSLLLTAEESDWELHKVLHKTLDNLQEQVRKKSNKKTINEKKIAKS